MPKYTNPETKDRRARHLFGCGFDLATALNDGAPLREHGSAAWRYVHQRQAAKDRGVEWAMNFQEWMGVWRDSCRWDQRGVGPGTYCMARNGDAGPYSVANVSIQSNAHNSRDGGAKGSAEMRAAGATKLGSGRGWCFVGRNAGKPYQVSVAHRYVGSFATPAEAEAAYAAACSAARVKELVSHDHSVFCAPKFVMATDGNSK